MKGNGLTDTAAGTGDNNNFVCTIIHDLISLLCDSKIKGREELKNNDDFFNFRLEYIVYIEWNDIRLKLNGVQGKVSISF